MMTGLEQENQALRTELAMLEGQVRQTQQSSFDVRFELLKRPAAKAAASRDDA